MRILSKCIIAVLYLLPGVCSAGTHYSKQDSARAKAYFDSSWSYGLGSVKHQLYLDSALQVIPTHAYYWQQKSMPLYKAFKFELGRPFLDSAVKYDPGRWLDYAAYMKCIFARQYREALEDFYRAKVLNGNGSVMDHPYNFYIGLCHLQLNNFDSSEHYIKSCIEEAEKNRGESWVHYNHLFYMGIVSYEKTNYKSAIEYFDKALKQYPQFSDAQYYKALCCNATKQKNEALTLMEKAYINYKEGYSLNEDNARYEYYPYQVREYGLTSTLAWMKAEAAKKQAR